MNWWKCQPDLRIYNLVATLKIVSWVMLRMHLWPVRRVPRLPDLRVISDFDVVKKYRTFVETTACLSRTYGEEYCRQLLNAL